MKRDPITIRFKRWSDGRNVWRRTAFRVVVLMLFPLWLLAATVCCVGESGIWDDVRFIAREFSHHFRYFVGCFWRGTPRRA